MNFVAAVLLMHAPSEEEAFYCLVSVVEDVLPAYYAQDMSATQVRVSGHPLSAWMSSVAALV
eukprot:613439-Pelagomonas_calceolata.AAC.1